MNVCVKLRFFTFHNKESIEKLIAEFTAKEQVLNKVKEDTLEVGESPSRR